MTQENIILLKAIEKTLIASNLTNDAKLLKAIIAEEENILLVPPVILPKRNHIDDPFELMKTGGMWLGTIRTYIQHNFIDGDRLTWNSEEELRPHITMKQLQEIAAHVAASVYKEINNVERRSK